jgi:hypothetical protein
MRGQLVFFEQREDVVNDLVLSLGEEVWLREGSFRDSCTWKRR